MRTSLVHAFENYYSITVFENNVNIILMLFENCYLFSEFSVLCVLYVFQNKK